MTSADRPRAVWTATHDHGWTTGAIENPDGTFATWATPTDQAGSIPADYIEDSPENAMRAADYALRQKTTHAECSPACSGWQLHARAPTTDAIK